MEKIFKPWQRKQEVIQRGKEYQERTGKLPDEDIFGEAVEAALNKVQSASALSKDDDVL